MDSTDNKVQIRTLLLLSMYLAPVPVHRQQALQTPVWPSQSEWEAGKPWSQMRRLKFRVEDLFSHLYHVHNVEMAISKYSSDETAVM
jgi:hypothetical protein